MAYDFREEFLPPTGRGARRKNPAYTPQTLNFGRAGSSPNPAYLANIKSEQDKANSLLTQQQLAASVGMESTVAGNLSKEAIPASMKMFEKPNLGINQEQVNMPMFTAPAQTITGTNPMEFGKPNKAVQSLNSMPVTQNTEVQAPIIKADSNNPDNSHNDFMQRYLEKAANNSVGIQGMNAANSATAYNNMLEAGIARGQNSRSKGSYTPTYQKAVVYTPQAMNFGGNQQQQVSNPYLGMFDGKGISVAPSKNTVYPSNMDMTQNGKSLFDSNRKLSPSPELSNQMKKYYMGF